ncbi:hypothetical protein D3C73_1629110 [compost metagenome]
MAIILMPEQIPPHQGIQSFRTLPCKLAWQAARTADPKMHPELQRPEDALIDPADQLQHGFLDIP